MSETQNLRILVVDDQEAIRDDFKKILATHNAPAPALSSARAAFFGGDVSAPAASVAPLFQLTLASQGEQALELGVEPSHYAYGPGRTEDPS